MAKEQIGLRIEADLLERLRRATDRERDHYAPTMTQVVERGVELSLREIERKKK